MDFLSQVLHDPFMLIVYNLTIKDIIGLSRLSCYFHQIISEEFDECVHSLAQTNKINSLGLEYSKTFYLKYNRGKSYPIGEFRSNSKFPELGNQDVPFYLSDGEYILYFSDMKLSEYDPGSIIVTINRLLQYTVYQFKQEVDPEQEYTPDYHGWDDSDINIIVVEEKQKYSNINEIRVANFWCVKPALRMIWDALMVFPNMLEEKELIYPDVECDFYR